MTLASGDTMTLDLYGDKLVSVAASDKLMHQSVTQAGRIEAAGGEVVLTTADAKNVIDRVINMDGWVDVNGLTEEAGSIILHAGGGDVNVSGELHANGTRGWGGRLQITGENVRVGAGALLTAAGKTGGGQILIGGDYLGGGTTPHAKTTVDRAGRGDQSQRRRHGDGGRVIVWSDERTDFAGTDSGQRRAARRRWRIHRDLVEGHPHRARSRRCVRAEGQRRRMAARSEQHHDQHDGGRQRRGRAGLRDHR